MPRLRDEFIHLESRKLSAFARLRSLRHLDLDLVRIDKIVGIDAETSRCHLLYGTPGIAPVRKRMVPFRILSALAGIAPSAETVHRYGNGLVRLLAYGSE